MRSRRSPSPRYCWPGAARRSRHRPRPAARRPPRARRPPAPSTAPPRRAAPTRSRRRWPRPRRARGYASPVPRSPTPIWWSTASGTADSPVVLVRRGDDAGPVGHGPGQSRRRRGLRRDRRCGHRAERDRPVRPRQSGRAGQPGRNQLRGDLQRRRHRGQHRCRHRRRRDPGRGAADHRAAQLRERIGAARGLGRRRHPLLRQRHPDPPEHRVRHQADRLSERHRTAHRLLPDVRQLAGRPR